MKFGPSARELANGHWREILVAAGIDEDVLDGEHHPCPLCGGTDRFRFDDKDGRGTYFCNGCGAGDGFQLLMKYQCTSSFVEAARFVEGYFKGQSTPIAAPAKPVQQSSAQDDRKRIARKLQKAWAESLPLTAGDPVYRYLTETRKLPIEGLTNCLRLHPGMGYFEKVKVGDGKVGYKKRGTHPVMLAKATAPTAQPVGLHRSYLTQDGKKAPYAKTKKSMKGLGLHGAAIRLYPVTGAVMGVAEGIETSIAGRALTGVPTWATISSTIMEGFEPPAEVKLLVIFVDNDHPDEKGRRAGFYAAQVLKERLEARGIQVILVVPTTVGTDMDDVWQVRTAALTDQSPRVNLYAGTACMRAAQTIAARIERQGVRSTVRSYAPTDGETLPHPQRHAA
ncbi:DUF7146 domain-containing protein [Aromatoleum evansii]|uniref:DUF7146 domain-containing protein n=1 Tax=Aromatoleum evansii TaxID=59406 RepID=UPI00145C8939|nr:primase-helicase zinc-binding domain-containing protein [Aromatoleum evansii]NMG28380.1 hypothetical protein [Aromatoleum evansii]